MDHVRGGGHLAGHMGQGIEPQRLIQDGVGDAVAHLVRMAFGNALRCKIRNNMAIPVTILIERVLSGQARCKNK